jgi:glucose-1-phosphate thymidylyltransferase
MTATPGDVVGLLPAAGRAKRVGPLACSKEIFPLGFVSPDDGGIRRPRAACEYVLGAMHGAGIRRAYVVLRDGKWDIPAYLCDGHGVGTHLAYLMIRHSFGVPFTLDQAYPFVAGCRVALGFPDIVFHPCDAYESLIERQESTGADVVLGLFPATRPQKMDMVDIDEHGRVLSLEIKPENTDLEFAWVNAVWTPVFTEFLHRRVLDLEPQQGGDSPEPELFIGDVLREALEDGLRLETAVFPRGTYVDIGTPDDLEGAARSALSGFPSGS